MSVRWKKKGPGPYLARSGINRPDEIDYNLDMPRTIRISPAGMVFHVLNRGVGRMRVLHDDDDYLAFERIMEETLETLPAVSRRETTLQPFRRRRASSPSANQGTPNRVRSPRAAVTKSIPPQSSQSSQR